MDWAYIDPTDSSQLYSIGELGFYVGDKYKIAVNASTTLLSICEKLKNEDRSLHTFRRKLGFSQIVHKDLAPIIVECQSPEHLEVFAAAIKLFMELTTPFECLFAGLDFERNEDGATMLFEHKQFLSDVKNVFLDSRIAKSIMTQLENLLENDDASTDLKTHEKHCIVNSITLIRNVLHIPEPDKTPDSNSENTNSATTEEPISSNSDANSGDGDTFVNDTAMVPAKEQSSRRQHQVLWNLFAHNLDSVIMSAIESKEFKMWSTPLVQLLALVYKDQHVGTLERLLNIWLESSLSDSSGDDESNTSPQHIQDGICSSSLLTSTEPNSTDDSSDGNGGNSNGVDERSVSSDKGTCGKNRQHPSGHLQSGWFAQVAKNGHVSFKNNELHAHTQQQNMYFLGMGPLPPLPFVTIPPHTLPNPVLSYSKKPSMAKPNLTGDGSSAPVSPLDPTLIAGDGVIIEAEKSPKPIQVAVTPPNLDEDSMSDICKEPPKKKLALDVAATLLLEKKEDRKKEQRDNSNGAQTDSGFSSKSENIKAERVSENNTTTDKTSKQSKTAEQQNSETSSENQDMDVDKPNIRGSEMSNISKIDKKHSSSEEGYGYVSTQANLKPKTEQNSKEESNSTSSNDEENGRRKPHTNLQKPRPKKKIISAAEKRELRRKKLIERSKSKRLKVKALIHHVPTDEDIADLLKEFTVDFLLKSYPSLVTDLRKQLMSDENADIDKSHFLWLITYFLKFASQLEVELEQIGSVLCVETVAYLTYEGVRFFEELELAVRSQRERSSDLRPHLRRIHLVVTALREFIQTLQLYGKFTHFSEKDKIKVTKVQEAVCGMRELRQLFLLLIRRYNSSLQTRQYLNDIICGNHALLVMIENTKMDVEIMTAHLAQFATVEVMRQYGQLLTYFYSNPESVNDCIFTMMHHVSGDLNAPENLFIPQVLETFSDIWEREDIEICDDWADLIEYVIQKFISTIGTRPHAYASNLLECINNSEAADENGFTRVQLENLYSYYTQFEDAPDTVGCIIEMYKENSNVTKTRLAVIQALLSQGIISLAQYMNMMYMKSVLTASKAEHEGSVVAEVGSEKCESEGHDTDIENAHDLNAQNKDLETLKEILIKQGKTCLLTWLQQTLIDACYVKVNGIDLFKEDGESLEPVPFHFNYINQSIPMVAWNKNQECGLQTEHFILLLHKLGFHLATDVGKCFPRIPDHWPADHLYHLALKVGPLKKEHLKMDLTILEKTFTIEGQEQHSNFNAPMSPIADISEPVGSTALKPLTPLTPLEPLSEPCSFAMPTPTTSWIQMALNSKKAEKSKVVTCVSGNMPRPMSIGSDLSDAGSDISMEKMQITDDEK